MSLSGIELIDRGFEFHDRLAIIDNTGEYTFGDLLEKSFLIASALLNGEGDLNESRVSFLVPSGFNYVAVKWGIWRAGGISVPLCTFHPETELAYTIDDSMSETVIVHPDYCDKVRNIADSRNIRLLGTGELYEPGEVELPVIDQQRRAMMLYTSGTTSKPKGVVTTHSNIRAQVISVVNAWGWNPDDYILNTLPLHHLHGILNLLLCPLWSGASCELHEKFDVKRVWDTIESGRLTLFMGVPTMYYKLIDYWESADAGEKQKLGESASRLRLMVSGSSALPVKTFEKWRHITGHTLLERYGMTEIGMALTNPLHGERIPGSVGKPLAGIEVEIFDENGKRIDRPDIPGEIMVRGEGVFKEYWNRPEETGNSFNNGWFRTGDIAVKDEDGNFRILGRDSVDIIKSGGYKISALEIEEILRTHEDVKECSVVGLPDEEWGETVAAAIVAVEGAAIDPDSLREWSKTRMAVYKVPRSYKVVSELPRNVLGKVLKNSVKELFDSPT